MAIMDANGSLSAGSQSANWRSLCGAVEEGFEQRRQVMDGRGGYVRVCKKFGMILTGRCVGIMLIMDLPFAYDAERAIQGRWQS